MRFGSGPFFSRWIVIPVLLAAAAAVEASDWPMWRGDAGHAASSEHELPPALQLHWIRQYSPRVPVWDDPLNRDMMPYDRMFEPVVADGRMFLGFNDSDKVVALNVEDGSEIWSYFTDGPVRFSPVAYQGRVYVTSDDGYLYCLAADNGSLRWRFRGGPSDRRVVGNRRVISSWPARGGPVVADGAVCFAASIWPFMGTFIYALDAETGQVRWCNDGTSADFQKQPHNAPSFAGVAPQGQLTVAGDLLLVPGGRSLPAGFDLQTGELRFFNFGGKGEGGSFVAADKSRAFVHTRVRGTMQLDLPKGDATKFRINEPVIADGILYAARDGSEGENGDKSEPPTIAAHGKDSKKLWEIAANGTGDLIRAGNRLYAAGKEKITAVDLPRAGRPAEIAWSLPLDGTVVRLLAAADRLFAVTLDGRVLAFAQGEAEPRLLAHKPISPNPDKAAIQRAKALLAAAGQREGYTLWFGVDDPELLEAAVLESDLHVVAVDPDADRVKEMRNRFDRAGLYGDRIVVHKGTIDSFHAPPYIANLIVASRSARPAIGDARRLRRLYESVRPYGGALWVEGGGGSAESLAGGLAVDSLPKARLRLDTSGVVITREGALPGAADWTHAYGDVANTVKSDDRRVKLPLGILWFGGPSNMDILPRHAHGPSQQVVGGRLFIEGMNSLNAWDVYTGRILWKRTFPDLGTYQVYYDETYADTPLSTAYNQVHIPGANARGTNYVATDDGVYLVVGSRCLQLDAVTGETIREFSLPAGEDGQTPDWGYVGVYDDLLLAGVGFGNYSGRLGYEYTPSGKRGVAWSPDISGTLGLMAFDRRSGKTLWRIDAEHSFLHNAIVAGGGRIYVLDKLPKRVEEQNRRRGLDDPATYRLLCVDARTGQQLWHAGDVFGTWLSYSDEFDVLLQAGAAASDRSLDEVGAGMAVYRAADGHLLWKKPDLSYAGPCMLHGDMIITNSTSYKESQGAFNLLDGSPVVIPDPVTGEPFQWRFIRTYGCNTAVASEHLLTFRSGAAGFYDLANHGGTGNFGGFKSGCTSNLIVANGLLTAPDYTRTCTCAYQNQTSLALIPMPDNELWTYNLFAQPEEGLPAIKRVGINLGAPGDRVAEDGTPWVNFPADAGSSPDIHVEANEGVEWFCHHASRIRGGDYPWVAASGGKKIQQLTVQLPPPDRADDDQKGATVAYTVRMVFAEPDSATSPGERIFDVLLQGKVVSSGLDVVSKAGGPKQTFRQQWQDVPIDGSLDIELRQKSRRGPVLCGIEIIRQR